MKDGVATSSATPAPVSFPTAVKIASADIRLHAIVTHAPLASSVDAAWMELLYRRQRSFLNSIAVILITPVYQTVIGPVPQNLVAFIQTPKANIKLLQHLRGAYTPDSDLDLHRLLFKPKLRCTVVRSLCLVFSRSQRARAAFWLHEMLFMAFRIMTYHPQSMVAHSLLEVAVLIRIFITESGPLQEHNTIFKSVSTMDIIILNLRLSMLLSLLTLKLCLEHGAYSHCYFRWL